MDAEMNYQEQIVVRLFSNIRDKVRQIAKNAKDEHGIPKYESESHAIRSALMLFIKVEGEKMRGVNNGIREIREVEQTSDTKTVNQYLTQGYKIIKIISSKIPVNDQGDMMIVPMYVLGKK